MSSEWTRLNVTNPSPPPDFEIEGEYDWDGYRVSVITHRGECVQVMVDCESHDRLPNLRSLPLGDFVNDMYTGIDFDSIPAMTTFEWMDWYFSWKQTNPAPVSLSEMSKRPGRRGRPDVAYADLANLYVQHLSQGGTTATLAEEHNIQPATLRNLLGQARKRGLLGQAPQGKAGGGLTWKAMQILDRTR